MENNRSFFSYFARGATATHPLCSVFTLSILVFVFVFSSICYDVSAAVSDIPEMTNWQFSQALDAYSDLSDSQKEIADFLVGSQGYAFAGVSQSNLNSNFSSYSEMVDYVKNYGSKMWQQFNAHVDGIVSDTSNLVSSVKNDLSNFFGNAVTYAKSRSESFSAWLGNVGIDYNSSSSFRIQFGKDQSQNNVDFFGEEGLYNWQFSVLGFLTIRDYVSVPLSGALLQSYNEFYSSCVLPIRINRDNSSYTNSIVDVGELSQYSNLFIDTTSNSYYLVNSSGLRYSGSVINLRAVSAVVNSSNTPTRIETFYNNSRFISSSYSYNPASYTSYVSLARSIFNNFVYSGTYYFISDFVSHVYVGSSWDTREELFNITDLNLSPTSNYVTVNSPNNIIYLDLTGFMRDLYDNQTNIYNYVIDNSVDVDGDPVDSGDFSPISKFPLLPDSGISIGVNFFKVNGLNPLFGPDGYIAVLWNNTKGLVSYFGDLFSVLTFDDDGGLAFVVYGAISVGVISGIFSKFLL